MTISKHASGCDAPFACDCISDEELLAEYKADLESLEKGDISSIPSWTTLEESVAYVKKKIAELENV